MPFVQIDVTEEGVTNLQKQQLIAGVTQLLENILDKPPHLTHVIIREVSTQNWGLSGEQVSEIRKNNTHK